MAKGSLNKVMVIGRLGQDPELKYTPAGQAVCTFSVATDESYKDQSGNVVDKAEWHKIVVWRKLAEIAGQYLKKGSLVYCEGKLATRKWEKDGQNHYTTEIVASDMTMLAGKSDQGAGKSDQGAGKSDQGAGQNAQSQPAASSAQQTGFVQPGEIDEDDLPF